MTEQQKNTILDALWSFLFQTSDEIQVKNIINAAKAIKPAAAVAMEEYMASNRKTA